MRYLHAMLRVHDLEATNRFVQDKQADGSNDRRDLTIRKRCRGRRPLAGFYFTAASSAPQVRTSERLGIASD